MGIRFYCPNGHKLHVKAFQAGMRGICPHCGVSVDIPHESTRPSTKELNAQQKARPSAGTKKVSVQQRTRPSAVTPDGASQPATSGASASKSGTKSGKRSGSRASSRPASPEPPPPLEDFPDLAQPGPIGLSGLSGNVPEFQPVGETASSRPTSAADGFPAPPPAASPSGPDPLMEAPDAVWYVRPPTGGQYGPAGRDVMRVWIAEGRIGADSLVWREGWRDWREAAMVFPQLTPGPNDPLPGLRDIIEGGG